MDINHLFGKEVTNIKIIEETIDDLKFINEIKIYFAHQNIIIRPLSNTDELKISFSKNKDIEQVSLQENTLSKLIGKKLTFAWEGYNANGYLDVCILSFEYLTPNILFLSEGSSIKIFCIDKV